MKIGVGHFVTANVVDIEDKNREVKRIIMKKDLVVCFQ